MKLKTICLREYSRFLALASAVVLAAVLAIVPTGAAAAAENNYTIYPTPHSLTYGSGEVDLRAPAHLSIEEGIDAATVRRLDETLSLQKIPGLTTPVKGDGFEVKVGIYGSKGAVDKRVAELVESKTVTYPEGLFDKMDSYLLAVIPKSQGPAEIIVLGRDTDSAFYGLTSLYRIFQQVSDHTVTALTIADWADVQTRGFIEGYYGNPWSTQNRIDLMKFGGYNKLNAYFYAPKDDPKHNAKWAELYTQEELDTKIAPLATAGNESKTRFIYALHPFMSAQHRMTPDNYDTTLKELKAKYQQVIDAGTRQIAILADDAPNQGSDLYTRLLFDMTDWVHELQNEKNSDGSAKYPGLKDTIVFVPVNYYGLGEAWYADLPENVSVVNTGGRVWGKATPEIMETFASNSGGRSMFMWMNYPVSDNEHDSLHMGNYENFFGLGLTPGSLEGIVVNPMQQSEPSKVSLFLNADYTWNLWTDLGHADTTWSDSFSYVDHNSPQPTEASDALRAISQHLRQMYGGGVRWEGRESAAVKDTLVTLQNSMAQNSLTPEQIGAAKKVYNDILPELRTYRAGTANPVMAQQMLPWLDAFTDLSIAGDHYTQALQAYLDGDNDAMMAQYQLAEGAMASYGSHGFDYVGETEYAKVGKAYLSPTIDRMRDFLAPRVLLAVNPDAQITRFITSRTDVPEGEIASVFDSDPSTGLTYKTPNSITTGTYGGVVKTQPFDADSVTFTLGDPNGKNYFDAAQLQYTTDPQAALSPEKAKWIDVEGASNLTSSPVTVNDLGLSQIYGVRLIATKDNTRDAYFQVKEIEIGGSESEPVVNPVMENATASSNLQVWSGNGPARAIDGSLGTFFWSGQNTPVDGALTVTFAQPRTIAHATLVQSAKDKLGKGVIEYRDEDGQWHTIADIADGKAAGENLINDFSFDAVTATALRVRATEATNAWWQVKELSADDGSNVRDTSELSAAINKAAALKESDYSSFTWQMLQANLTRARNVLANPLSSQSDVDAATTSLTQAIDDLMPADGAAPPVEPMPAIPAENPVNKGALDGTLAADALLTSRDFSAETWAEYEKQMEQAQAVNEDKNATQAAVDEAFAQLREAMRALVAAAPNETASPAPDPTEDPTTAPGEDPTTAPGEDPTTAPGEDPTTAPGEDPTEDPTTAPVDRQTPGETRTPGGAPSEQPGSKTSDKDAAPKQSNGWKLPRTGTDVLVLGAVGAAVIAAGVGLTVVVRARKKR